MRRWIATIAAVTLALVVLGGCSLPANPLTRVSYGAFGLTNAKDFRGHVDEAWYDPNTGAWYVKNLDLTDSASPVREANVKQIEAYTPQVIAATVMAMNMMQQATSVVPWASHAGTQNYQAPPLQYSTPSGWQAAPTTQPITPQAAGPSPAAAPTLPAAPVDTGGKGT